jgi:hypothetical protein
MLCAGAEWRQTAGRQQPLPAKRLHGSASFQRTTTTTASNGVSSTLLQSNNGHDLTADQFPQIADLAVPSSQTADTLQQELPNMCAVQQNVCDSCTCMITVHVHAFASMLVRLLPAFVHL